MKTDLIHESVPGIRFAIVEDSNEYRHHIINLIGGTLKWELVAECVSVSQAMHDIPGLKPDIVLVDINLGADSGVDLISVLKRDSPATSVVMLTVVEDPETIVAALEAGACAYVVKEKDSEIIGALDDLANGRAGMSPAVARRLVEWFQNRRQPHTAKQYYALSDRQWQVLKLAARGRQHGEISLELNISPLTVKNHFRNIYEKLGVGTLTDALIKIKGGRGLLDD